MYLMRSHQQHSSRVTTRAYASSRAVLKLNILVMCCPHLQRVKLCEVPADSVAYAHYRAEKNNFAALYIEQMVVFGNVMPELSSVIASVSVRKKKEPARAHNKTRSRRADQASSIGSSLWRMRPET